MKWTVRRISRCKKKAKGPWVFLLYYKELFYLDKAFKCYGKKERNWKAFLWPMLRSKQLLFVFHNTTLKAIYLYANVVLFLWPKASVCLQTDISYLGLWSAVFKYFAAYFLRNCNIAGYMCCILLCSANTLRFPWQKLQLC